MKRFEILRAEVKVDIYSGESCEEHQKYFNAYAEGDKQDENFNGPLIFKLEDMPAGTKIIVTAPCCPNCYQIEELCNCQFNWKEWVEGQYS